MESAGGEIHRYSSRAVEDVCISDSEYKSSTANADDHCGLVGAHSRQRNSKKNIGVWHREAGDVDIRINRNCGYGGRGGFVDKNNMPCDVGDRKTSRCGTHDCPAILHHNGRRAGKIRVMGVLLVPSIAVKACT